MLVGDDYQYQFVLVLLNIDPIEEQLLKHVVLAKAYNAEHHLFKAFFNGNLSNVDGCALCLYFRIWNPGGILLLLATYYPLSLLAPCKAMHQMHNHQFIIVNDDRLLGWKIQGFHGKHGPHHVSR